MMIAGGCLHSPRAERSLLRLRLVAGADAAAAPTQPYRARDDLLVARGLRGRAFRTPVRTIPTMALWDWYRTNYLYIGS